MTWKCKDCSTIAKNSEAAKGWVAVMAVNLGGPADGGEGKVAVKPWYALCERCKISYDIPDDLEIPMEDVTTNPPGTTGESSMPLEKK